jgi:signal transduction histidine kinase
MRRLLIAVSSSALIALASDVIAAEVPPKRVLVLSAIRHGWSVQPLFERTLHATLLAGVPEGVEFFHEYIDAARFGDATPMEALRGFLRAKYAATPPDLVFAFGRDACEFVVNNRAELFSGTPVVVLADTCSVLGSDANSSSITGVLAPLDLSQTLDLALELQPETRHVFVVTGAADWEKVYGRMARTQFERFEPRLTFTYLDGLPMSRLERELFRLPPHSIVYYLAISRDGSGRAYSPTEALDRFASAVGAPIYSWLETYVDHGVTGARTVSMEALTRQAGEMAVRVLQGQPTADIPISIALADQTVINWSELRRWNIDQRRVPQSSVILNRKPSVTEQFRLEIAGILTLCGLQAALITGLLAQRERRRRAEQAAVRSEVALRTSYQQVQSLARRLIRAQEAERTRIARELHDDVNQQLAGLSIAISAMRRDLPGDAAELRGDVDRLQRHTTGLVETIRTLSHDLHPGSLRHIGLEPTLRSMCAEMGKLHDITLHFCATKELGCLPDDVALTLFRVAQEAIHNVILHARAQQAAVLVTRDEAGVQLRVTDDGCGFDAEGGSKGGLGLMSMEERVRLMGGDLTIESDPGGGTRVSVHIPLPPPALPDSHFHAEALPALAHSS